MLGKFFSLKHVSGDCIPVEVRKINMMGTIKVKIPYLTGEHDNCYIQSIQYCICSVPHFFFPSDGCGQYTYGLSVGSTLIASRPTELYVFDF